MEGTYITSLGISISTLLIIGTIVYLRSNSSKKANGCRKIKKKQAWKPKKPVKVLSLTEQYDLALTTVDSAVRKEIEPEVDTYYTEFDSLSLDDRLYKFNYYQETLLKELIKLDNIDLTLIDNEDLKKRFKDERKVIIKHIQSLQKRLDAYKKENSKKFP